jgi:TetR/AcrR family transcriptional repressor of nem operon
MARPREFDTLDALDRAMELFWTKGYEATSLQDLIDGMTVSKSSFYDTFGSKHDLYVMSLGRYIETVLAGAVARLESDEPGHQAILGVFDRLVRELTTPAGARGCFLDNGAVELALDDAQVRRQVETGRVRLTRAFRRAVRRGQADGSIAGHDSRALSRYLMNVRHGLIVTAKTRPRRRSLEATVRLSLGVLDRAAAADLAPAVTAGS